MVVCRCSSNTTEACLWWTVNSFQNHKCSQQISHPFLYISPISSIINSNSINSNYPKAQLTRQEQTLYNRLRIGHTYLTHSYLLKDEDPPICIPCNSVLTVEHILISCIDFDIIRQNFYTASNLKDLFHNIHPKRIISFVHAIGLTNKL